jgi:hypothetical protein
MELQRTKADTSQATFLYSIIGCIGTFLVAAVLSTALNWRVFHKYVRMGLAEYAATISIVFFVGMPYVGDLAYLDHKRLPIPCKYPICSYSSKILLSIC